MEIFLINISNIQEGLLLWLGWVAAILTLVFDEAWVVHFILNMM